MAKQASRQDSAMLTMALVGYELEKQRIAEAIAHVQEQLGHKPQPAAAKKPASSGAAKKKATAKYVLSDSARRRIALGQKRRWAAHRKRLAAESKT